MAIIVRRDENQQQVNDHGYRKLTPTTSYKTWIPSIGICFGLIVIGIVAAVIVLALIPTYLPAKNITVKNKLTDPLVITYRSDMVNGNALTITKMAALSRSFRNALHLQRFAILVAQFTPSEANSTRRKKRANDQFANNDTSIQGDLMTVQFSLKYPIFCGDDSCQNQVIEEARVHISVLYTTFSLPLSFTNGHTSIVRLSFCAVGSLPVTQCYTPEDEECSSCNGGSTNVCDSTPCNSPLTGLQNSNRFNSSDYVRDLLNPAYWVHTPGGNVSYFNLTTTPALSGIGIAFSLAMLEPCGIILPHIHPRGSKGIYSISGKSLLVGFIQENRAQVILNTIGIGSATVIPKGAIHFVQNLECTASTQVDAYNYEDPGLLTLGLNMFRFPDGPLSAAFDETDDYIDNLRKMIPGYPLDVNTACREKCGLST